MLRRPEPEYMDDPAEALAYAEADFAEVNQAFAERLCEVAGPVDGLAAVDLGTGPADIPVRILRLRPGWRITCIDASPAMLEHAREVVGAAGMADRVSLVLADAKQTGLPGGAFDVVFSNSILHHLMDTDAFWEETKRLGRPGALVFLRDLARPASAEEATAIVDRHAGEESGLLKEEFHRSLLSAFTVEEIQTQLARAGLEQLTVRMVTDRHLDVFGRLR
jgi:ubiquinone/menaquinone biosynthesis C-methylase UbiE